MAGQQQELHPDKPQVQKKRRRRPSRRLLLIITTIIVALTVTAVWIISSLGVIPTILASMLSAVFSVFGVVIGLLSFFSVPGKSELTTALPGGFTSSAPTPHTPIINVPPPLLSAKPAHRSIIGLPPPTDSRTIQQRVKAVEKIYAKLTRSDVTAIVLTGLGGVGKSTLAALVYHYTEEQRHAASELLQEKSIWLTINDSVTMTDLAATLFESLGKPVPNLGSMTLQSQAIALFNALNTVEEARLVILDQFENLLDWQTGYALVDRPGVGEWLDAINSQPCRCRILLTSRPWPQGTREYPPTYMQEHQVGGLEIEEGIELLRKQGVEATEAELRSAVESCEGHAFALTLLASLLRRNRSLSLTTLFKDPTYTQLWTGNIARNLLDYIYRMQLSEMQRKLLLAFSIYREPVPLNAVQSLVNFSLEVPGTWLLSALQVMITQHLLQTPGEGRYNLHAIVVNYAQTHFDESDERANRQSLQVAHTRAAQYYLQQSAVSCPPRENRHRSSDIHLLIEVIWHLCQAEQWQEAYNLIEREAIFFDLNHWGENALILELCKLLLPLDRWQPEPSQAAQISNDLGRAYNVLGKKDEALKYYKEALRIRREIGDRGGEGLTLSDLGWLYGDLRRWEEALEYLNQALRLHREVEDRRREGWTLSHLGWIYGGLGKWKEALEYLDQALLILREVKDRRGEGRVLNNLSKVYNALGKQEDALKCLEQALGIFRGRGDRRGEGLALRNLSKVYSVLGKKGEALHYLEQAWHILKEVGDLEQEGRVLNDLGEAYNMQGDKELALKYFKQAWHILREVEPQAHQVVEQVLNEKIDTKEII